MDRKILITGTGRCGTTFLMKIFTHLNMDTGFTTNNMNDFIYKNCKSGLEDPKLTATIIKSPKFSYQLQELNKQFKIQLVIIPIRNMDDTTKSRVNNGNNNGGMPNGIKNSEDMLYENYRRLAILISDVVRLDLNFVLIDFHKMIKDPFYLYNQLKFIMTDNKIKVLDFYEAWKKSQN